MNNIKFNYLYRDGSNYQSWGEMIFSNPENLAVNEVEVKLLNAFLPDKQFVASQISVSEKFFTANLSLTQPVSCLMTCNCNIKFRFAAKVIVEVKQSAMEDSLNSSKYNL